MRDQNVSPNAETLVCALQAVASAVSKHQSNYRSGCELALSVVSELRQGGVEPSLGAYRQLLEIYYSKEH